MKSIFDFTYRVLMFLAKLTGFSYKEINVIVWFIIIPLVWIFLIDKIRKSNHLKIAFSVLILIVLIVIKNFSEFSNSVFDTSADFLRSFDHMGSNYTLTSVFICLIVPLLITIGLIKKAFFKK